MSRAVGGGHAAEHCGRLRRCRSGTGGLAMRYRVFSGPPGSGAVSPLEKARLLFKEFDSLDVALAWARHLQENGRVALSIDGDDGTSLSKQEIAAALHHPENAGLPKAP